MSSFRMNNVSTKITENNVPKKSITTQQDIDVIDAKYKNSKIKKPEEPVNQVLTEYKKSLVKESPIKKQTIKYDKTTGKWRITTE